MGKNKDSICIKCGADNSIVRYRDSDNDKEGWLVYKCCNCEYSWKGKTKDSKQ